MPEETKKRFDLSLPQVAGSALAAVLAAKLASTLGVYGTILGAGVISVIATCGGPLLQHLFKRTGEQMRGAGTADRPKPRQTSAPYGDEFGEPSTHGTRVRGRKRSALGAAVVFVVAMGGITAYELTSGQDLGGVKGSTTFGSAVRGEGGGGDGGEGGQRPVTGGTPSPGPGRDRKDDRRDDRKDDRRDDREDDRNGGGTATPTPTPDRTSGPATPAPEPTPSASTEPTGGGSTPPATPPAAPPTAQAPTGDGAE
ncbi:hypothetical protein [Streptomyces roseicoloratus]|uniref:hypothetical protein n=1 Tax=Streptomyces roseicoloratus TaxID=2508722 RepID=UPI001FE78909|nr:hypothetical protein [Streptomyces roseicoloratus]